MIKLYFVMVHIELWNYEVTRLTVLMIAHVIRIYVLIIFQIMKLGWSHSTFQNSKTNLSHFTSNKRGLIIGSLSYYSYYYNAFVSLLVILKPSTCFICFRTVDHINDDINEHINQEQQLVHHTSYRHYICLVVWKIFHFSIYWESYSQLTNSYFSEG